MSRLVLPLVLLAGLLLAWLLTDSDADAPPAGATAPDGGAATADAPATLPPRSPAEAARLSDEWWQRAERALARVDDPDTASWAHAYLALCLERLGREAEAEARLERVDDRSQRAFALCRLALQAWAKDQPERFARLATRLAELAPTVPHDASRRHHHALLHVLQLARGDEAAADAAAAAARAEPAPDADADADTLERERLDARLALLAGLGREPAWRDTWARRHERAPELADLAPLLRGLLGAGAPGRVAEQLEASLDGALGEAATRPDADGLLPAQLLLADWARAGLADAALPAWDRLQARRPWPAAAPPPPAELGRALARAGRHAKAQAFAERLPPDAAARVHAALAVALEEAGARSAADALIERVDLAERPELRLRRLLARAARAPDAATRAAAVDVFVEQLDGRPEPADSDLLDALVGLLHDQGDRAQLERVADLLVPRLTETQALPTLARLTAGTGLDARLFRQADALFGDEPGPAALLHALAALAARQGPRAELPPIDVGLRVDQVVAALAAPRGAGQGPAQAVESGR